MIYQRFIQIDFCRYSTVSSFGEVDPGCMHDFYFSPLLHPSPTNPLMPPKMHDFYFSMLLPLALTIPSMLMTRKTNVYSQSPPHSSAFEVRQSNPHPGSAFPLLPHSLPRLSPPTPKPTHTPPTPTPRPSYRKPHNYTQRRGNPAGSGSRKRSARSGCSSWL